MWFLAARSTGTADVEGPVAHRGSQFGYDTGVMDGQANPLASVQSASLLAAIMWLALLLAICVGYQRAVEPAASDECSLVRPAADGRWPNRPAPNSL